jgi:hypothetical protein
MLSELFGCPVGENIVDSVAGDTQPVGDIVECRGTWYLPVRVDLDCDGNPLPVGGHRHDAEHHAVGYLPRGLAS